MPDYSVFNIAGSAMSAQSVRLNTVASNLANADAVAGSPDAVYRPLSPVFESTGARGEPGGVRVADVVEGQGEPQRRFQPGHPQADEQGYVYAPDVNVVEQMVDMISASRTYENSVEVLNTSKQLMLRTLEFGR